LDETDSLVTTVSYGTVIKASDYERRWSSDVAMTGRGKPDYLKKKTSPSAFYAAVIPYEVRPD
jgi:hypothetical protein